MEKEVLNNSIEDKEYEAEALIDQAIGLLQALDDQLSSIIQPVRKVEKYENITDEEKTLVAYDVVSRKKTLITLPYVALKMLDKAQENLRQGVWLNGRINIYFIGYQQH